MSACRCTDTEVCFPCRDREAHGKPEAGRFTTAAAAASALAEAPDVAPATDEQIAGYEMRTFREAWRVEDWEYALDGAIARVRQERAGRDRAMDYADEQSAEAARLREQVAAMQAADAGSFW